MDQGASCDDVWTWVQEKQFQQINSQAKERVGYPTQKPLALLERIIKASSNEDDLILDPFCGCATACIAAEMLGRQWTGIDISPKAAELVKLRMHKEVGLFYTGAHRTDTPQRTDVVPIRPYVIRRTNSTYMAFREVPATVVESTLNASFRNRPHSATLQRRHRPYRKLAVALRFVQSDKG